MFEEEAKEYADEKCGTIETEEKKFCRFDWRNGAEFGYNKAKEDAKKIMNIAIGGIKRWGVVGGKERPFEKQAEMLFNLFLEKAEQFISDVKIREVTE